MKDRTDQGRRRDEEHDERLDHLDKVDRYAGARLHLHTTRPQGSEEQTREHRAAGGGPAKQGNRDGIETDARVDVLGDGAVGAEDLRDPRKTRETAVDPKPATKERRELDVAVHHVADCLAIGRSLESLQTEKECQKVERDVV